MQAVAGIDTWSVAWYLDEDSPGERAARALATKGTARGRLLPDPVAGHRVGYVEGPRLLWAEGHPNPDGLAGAVPDELRLVVDGIADELHDLGLDVPRREQAFDRSGSPGFAGVRRLDTTVDLHRLAVTGSAILTGVAAVRPPGQLQVITHRERGGRAIETVAWQGKAGRVARVYDKGVESGSHDRGERVRFEDQRRWPAGHRRGLDELTADNVGNIFRRRFQPLWLASKGIMVTGRSKAVERITEAVEEEEITAGEAIDAAGYLLLQSEGVEVGHRQTRWRHRKLVERLGLVLNDSPTEASQEAAIDLARELEEALSTPMLGHRFTERPQG